VAAKKILESNGYQEEADKIDPFDPLGLGISFLGPLAFGAGAHAMRGAKAKAKTAAELASTEPPGKQTPVAQAIEQTYTREQVDAARVLDLQAHRESQALHAREDVAAGAAHERALDRAGEQLAAGKRVSVADVAPVDAMRMGEAIQEPMARLRQELNPITRDMAARIDDDFRGAVDEYSRLEGTDGGRILNTDEARELSPAYRKNRTLSADVHEPASAFVKRLYAEKLAQPTPAGRDPLVLFTAGGTGAGKSTGLQLMGKTAARAEMIYDTNMNGLASSVSKIEQALEAGRQVQILYTYRDAVDALKNGALPRAMRMGRTVPLREHARTHQGAAETVRALAEKYAGDERVSIRAVDNSRGKDNARLASLDELPQVDYTGLEVKLHEALDQEHAAGRISEQVRAGTAGAAASPEPQGAIGPDRPGVRGQLEQADGGSPSQAVLAPEAVDAYLDAQVAHIEANTPDILVQLEGMDAPMRASELLAQVREEAKQAMADAPLLKVAAECALRG
jgi:hypothetical protein